MSSGTINSPSTERFLTELEETIREEPLNLERLERYGVDLARKLEIDPRQGRNDSFFTRVRDNASALREAHRVLVAAAAAGEPSSIDVEWLLDNFSVVEDHLREIHEDLPRDYYHELPKTKRSLPRVYEMALGIIAHTDSAPDEVTLERFLQAFQQVAPLSIGETWAFPIMLRLALVENLRRISQQILAARKCRKDAKKLIDEATDGKPIALDLDSIEQCAPTIIELLELLEAESPTPNSRRNELEQRLRDKSWDLSEIVRNAHRRQAANQVTIGNLITSMRLTSALDWMAFFEQVSLAEQALRADPAQVYAQMDPASRDRYRQAVEQIAKRSKKSDLLVARRVTAAAEAARDRKASSLEQHVGYYLLGAGRPLLEKEMGYRERTGESIVRWVLRNPSLVYLGGTALLTLLIVGLFGAGLWLATTGPESENAAWIFLLCLLAVLPANELAISIVNLAVTTWIPPRVLPKLEFREGVPLSRSTLVVAPSMLSSKSEINSLLGRLSRIT